MVCVCDLCIWCVLLPIVIALIPVVKMDQESTVHHVCNRGNADEGGVLFVNGLQLHPNTEPLGCDGLEHTHTHTY